jgi:hypothetical protein
MIEFTTVVAIDQEHLRELRVVWPTWVRNRPEVMDFPLLILADGVHTRSFWQSELSFLGHNECQLELWEQEEVTQREKMLTALVLGAARHVQTKWYLKLDTDTAALRPQRWIFADWFSPDADGRTPEFIASPWGYTKPADAIVRLDAWGDKIAKLSQFPALKIDPGPNATLVSHRRIISWCFFGATDTLQEAAQCCGDRLPVPSQDTFLWYWSARRRAFFRRIAMKQFGWGHISRFRKLKAACDQACNSEPAS